MAIGTKEIKVKVVFENLSLWNCIKLRILGTAGKEIFKMFEKLKNTD